MVDFNVLYQKQYSYIRPFNRIRGQKEEPDSAGSDLDLAEPTEKRSLTEEQSSMFTRAPHGVWTHPSVIREQKKGSEFDKVKHQLLRGSKEEGSSDCESVSSCVSFKSDRSMPRFIDFKDSRPSAPKRMENKLSNMVDCMKLHENVQMAHMKQLFQHVRPVSDGIRPERPLKTGSEPEPYVNPFEHRQRKFTSMENKLSSMADLMQEREDAMMAHMKSMENKLDLMKEREDEKMAHIKSMENKLSSMADLMKEREDALMAHIKLMENKLSNMADLMKAREDVLMAQNKLKKSRKDEGSDSTESEHEPRDEPSSHSDSDGKSSCESFNSDDSKKELIDF